MHLGAGLPPVKPQLAGVQTWGGPESAIEECARAPVHSGAAEPVCTGHSFLSQWTPTIG